MLLAETVFCGFVANCLRAKCADYSFLLARQRFSESLVRVLRGKRNRIVRRGLILCRGLYICLTIACRLAEPVTSVSWDAAIPYCFGRKSRGVFIPRRLKFLPQVPALQSSVEDFGFRRRASTINGVLVGASTIDGVHIGCGSFGGFAGPARLAGFCRVLLALLWVCGVR